MAELLIECVFCGKLTPVDSGAGYDCSHCGRHIHFAELVDDKVIDVTPTKVEVVGAEQETKAKTFHAHLDVCEQCRTKPFNLCPLGYGLLHYAVTGPAAVLTPSEPAEEPGRAASVPPASPRLGLLFCFALCLLAGCCTATPPRSAADLLSERRAIVREQLLAELYGEVIPGPIDAPPGDF